MKFSWSPKIYIRSLSVVPKTRRARRNGTTPTKNEKTTRESKPLAVRIMNDAMHGIFCLARSATKSVLVCSFPIFRFLGKACWSGGLAGLVSFFTFCLLFCAHHRPKPRVVSLKNAAGTIHLHWLFLPKGQRSFH